MDEEVKNMIKSYRNTIRRLEMEGDFAKLSQIHWALYSLHAEASIILDEMCTEEAGA